nr:hypothetical protein REQ54_04303 [Rhizobium sp. Q54]
MLNDEQRRLIEQGVLDLLPEFEASGEAFTSVMLISRLREDNRFLEGGPLDQDDAERLVADIITRRVDEREGQPRQLVLLEAEPEPRWGYKDA